MRGYATAILVAVLLLTTALAPPAGANGDVHVVCTSMDQDPACGFSSIQDAVDAASPGDTIEILQGTFEENVVVGTPDLTIDGAGQNVTVLEGDGIDANGIFVRADGVTIRELTVQNFGGNGVYYDGVTGFYVERVTAIGNTPYGIYAIRSEEGWIRDSFATEHADSGFYIGETLDCECVLENLNARGNLIGYSGTAASGVTIRDSFFHDNAAGIVPNVLPGEPLPQLNLTVVDNRVIDNNNLTASEKWHFSGFVHVPPGLGVVIAGGSNNTVTGNTITGHSLAGVAIAWLFTEPSLNRVTDNVLDNPGDDVAPDRPIAPSVAEPFEDDPVDILWDGGGVGNCFEGNVREDGSATTFEGGPVWNTLGRPDCSTPSAAPPWAGALARELSLLLFHCEPDQHVTDPSPCHQHVA